jgi:CRISPR-associated protein Cmr2
MTTTSNKDSRYEIPDPGFLIFSITPVQGFISTARKTKDFWLGSYILSYLSWRGIDIIVKEFGQQAVIFPDLEQQPFFLNSIGETVTEKQLKTPTIPNRFVALIPYEKGKALLTEVEEAVKQGFLDIRDTVLDKLSKDKKNESIDDAFIEIFKRQTDSFFQFNGMVFPWSFDEKNPQDLSVENVGKRIRSLFGDDFEIEELENAKVIDDLYPVLYDMAERFSASLKSTRTIKTNKPEAGHKCTLCGEREALHPAGKTGWNDLTQFWKSMRKNYKGDISEGEKLCGLCLTKRMSLSFFKKKYQIDERFPSTADIATRIFRNEAEANLAEYRNFQNEIKKYSEKHKEDGEWLYKDFYGTRKMAEKIDPKSGGNENLKKLLELLDDLLKAADKKNILKPSKYYVIVKMDGDRMGRILTGELHGPVSRDLHKEISSNLGNFALTFVRQAVEERGKGKVIFAGGDDVFALLPPEYFFDAVLQLRNSYSGQVHAEATASLGAAIVHWEEPLALAIKMADAAEHAAKEAGRNAFCIKLKRRSGELRECCFNWYYENGQGERFDVMKELIEPLQDAFRKEHLSPRFIQALKLEFFKMDRDAGDTEEIGPDLREIFIAETRRTMGRSFDTDKGDRDIFVNGITSALKKMDTFYRSKKENGLWQHVDPFASMKNILFLFETVHFLTIGGEK